MGKIRKFAQLHIQKIIGGRDPVRLIEEFILKLNFDPDQYCKDKDSDSIRWLVPIQENIELEILLENLKNHTESTVYMGVNLITVPLKQAYEMLVTALEIADGLVGIKISLVGHYLVLSSTLGAHDMTLEDLEYNFQLINSQRKWFIDALNDQLGLDHE